MPKDGDTLPLESRSGIPDEVAYLRAAYPQAEWRGHANFRDLAAFWLHIHATLRQEAAALSALTDAMRERRIDRAAALSRFVPAFNGFLQHLDGHHRIEDGAYFPRFRLLDPRMERGLTLLESDHVTIDTALYATLDSARAMVGATTPDGHARLADRHTAAFAYLARLLDRHLADEEDIVIPALLDHGERALG